MTVEDVSGNTVTTNVTPITLSIPAGATLACTANPPTTTAGVATFGGCNITGAAASYTITASNGVLPTVNSTAVVIT